MCEMKIHMIYLHSVCKNLTLLYSFLQVIRGNSVVLMEALDRVWHWNTVEPLCCKYILVMVISQWLLELIWVLPMERMCKEKHCNEDAHVDDAVDDVKDFCILDILNINTWISFKNSRYWSYLDREENKQYSVLFCCQRTKIIMVH